MVLQIITNVDNRELRQLDGIEFENFQRSLTVAFLAKSFHLIFRSKRKLEHFNMK